MYSSELCNFSFWWLIPIGMMILCFAMMRGRRGAMMCGFGSRKINNRQTRDSDTALDILDQRYASGEIDKAEYEDKKSTLTESTTTRPSDGLDSQS